MAKVTWIGWPDGPKETVWSGITFKVGEAVEVTDMEIVRRASAKQFFRVEGLENRGPLLHPAPSEMSAQGPVPKPGEPVRPQEPPKAPLAEPKAEELKAPDYQSQLSQPEPKAQVLAPVPPVVSRR